MKKIFLITPFLLTACAVGPDYKRPDAPTSAEFKEANDAWKQAQPRDEIARGTWWEIFGDPLLNELVAKVEVSNQTLAASEAQFRQAQAAINAARAPFFPSLDGNASNPEKARTYGEAVKLLSHLAARLIGKET